MKPLLASISVIITISVLSAGTSHLDSTKPDSGITLVDKIENLLKPEVEAGRFSGVALVAKEGKIIFEQAYGMADVNAEKPNTSDTRFLIYSTTKQLTATLTMKLMAGDIISLDDSVRKYIPEAPESWQPVTVHHLLTHSSGIPDRLNDLLTFYDGNDQSTLVAVIKNLKDTELTSKPGEIWRYSNFGYQILGVILERASGKGYGELIKEMIFNEAGMTDSGTIAPAHPKGKPEGCAPVPGLAQGYNGTPDDLQSATSLMYINLGAGGVYATARDILRYDNLLRQGEFLDCDTQRIMLDRGFKINDDVSYGYGWFIRQPKDGLYTFEHSGGTNGFTSQYIRVPRHNLCIVLLSNHGFAPMRKVGGSILELLLSDT